MGGIARSVLHSCLISLRDPRRSLAIVRYGVHEYEKLLFGYSIIFVMLRIRVNRLRFFRTKIKGGGGRWAFPHAFLRFDAFNAGV